MGADYSFYVKTIETHARAFFKVIIFSRSSVVSMYIGGETLGKPLVIVRELDNRQLFLT